MVRLDFPYEAPAKINSFTLDSKPEFEGVLKGIKNSICILMKGFHQCEKPRKVM